MADQPLLQLWLARQTGDLGDNQDIFSAYGGFVVGSMFDEKGDLTPSRVEIKPGNQATMTVPSGSIEAGPHLVEPEARRVIDIIGSPVTNPRAVDDAFTEAFRRARETNGGIGMPDLTLTWNEGKEQATALVPPITFTHQAVVLDAIDYLKYAFRNGQSGAEHLLKVAQLAMQEAWS